jgi:hypothetical protein
MKVKILSSSVVEQHYQIIYSPIQKLVCKLFKITPHQKYHSIIIYAELQLPNTLQTGDIVICEHGYCWRLVAIPKDSFVYLMNQYPLNMDFKGIGKVVRLVSRSYSEKQSKIHN